MHKYVNEMLIAARENILEGFRKPVPMQFSVTKSDMHEVGTEREVKWYAWHPSNSGWDVGSDLFTLEHEPLH